MPFCGCDCADTMADVNVNAPAEQAPAMAPPTRTDDQILPRSRWVPVGKSNCYLDVEKSQNNPIYKITVDILKHTNFFRAFIASSTIPSIYIQQFWDTVRYDKTTGSYSCQLDEQWLDLTKDTLRDALQITPVDNNNAFSSPPTPDVLIKFVNDLGYPKAVRTLSDVVTNDMFQPWRALTTIINLCLTGKTSGFERPRAPVLQILWGVVNQAHIDYAERMWEEFTQSIHTFIEDKKNLARHTQGRKKANLIVIPSVRFTKLIIHHLQSKHKFHPRPGSPLHLPNEESVLGYLKFSAKGTKREVFGMPILNELSMLTYKESSEASSPAKQPKAGKVIKKRTHKSSLQLVDEFIDEGIPVNEPRFGDEEADMQRAVEESLKDIHAAHRGPLPPVVFREPDFGRHQPLLERRTHTPSKPSGDDESHSLYAELGLADREMESDEEVKGIYAEIQDEGQAEPNPDVQDEGQAGSNPSNTAESQPQSSLVVHAGPNLEHMGFEATNASIQQNPEHMDEEFTTTVYLNVQENLKLLTEDQVRLEEPISSVGTLSSLQNLDKEASPISSLWRSHRKTNLRKPILNRRFISQPVPTMVQAPLPTSIATVTAITTATSQPQQSTSDPILISRIGQLEHHIADLMQTNINLEERLDKHGSCLYQLENLNIPHQVSKVIDEIVIDAVDWAMQAPLRDRFRDLPESDMKEILHHRMWESNSYKAHKDHMKLYEALEKSMNRDQTDQLLTDLAEVQRKKKMRHDSPKTPPGSLPHQPPPPPPPAGPSGTSGSSGASGSSQLLPPPPPPSTNQSDQSKGTAARDGNKTRTRWGPDPQTQIDWGIPELTGDGDGDGDGESPNYETGDGAGMGIT
ncbi:hypothetical protein Tco_0116514 [Tanacetum coccineum]